MSEPVPVRRLILMRHAKSSWDAQVVSDHQRPLNKRGRRDAPRMAEALVERDWIPDVVVCSDSTRTTETWQRMAPHMGRKIATYYEGRLYHASIDSFRRVIRGVPDEVETLMLVSHNPGCEDFLGWLAGLHETMTTANCALLETDAASWDEVQAQAGMFELIDLLRPKEL